MGTCKGEVDVADSDGDQGLGNETCGGDNLLSPAKAQRDKTTKGCGLRILLLPLLRSASKMENMTIVSKNMVVFT